MNLRATFTKTTLEGSKPELSFASSMQITDWDRLDGLSPQETADDFRREHAAQARLSLEEFDRYLVVEREGDHWIAVPQTLVKREQREQRREELRRQREA